MKALSTRLTIAMALLAGLAVPSYAAWGIDDHVDDLGWDISGYVLGASETHWLSIGCYEDPYDAGRVVTVGTGEDYDETASYAPRVPMTLRAGDRRVQILGAFENFGALAVDAIEDHVPFWQDAVDLVGYAESAGLPIEVSFFDTALTFPSEGGSATLFWIARLCQ